MLPKTWDIKYSEKQHGFWNEITVFKFQLFFLVIWLWANHLVSEAQYPLSENVTNNT